MAPGFRRLIAWQKAYEFTLTVYKETQGFPKHELYGLTSQLRRATVSILANISEGYERPHRKEYLRFLGIAKGSAGEVEAYLMLARDLGYITDNYLALEAQRKEVAMVLIGLIGSLRDQGPGARVQ